MKIEKLKKIRATMERVEVRGYDNLNYYLGVMMALDNLIAEEERENEQARKDAVCAADAGTGAG